MEKPVKTIVLRVLAVVSFLIASIVMFLSIQTVQLLICSSYSNYFNFGRDRFCLVVYCIGWLYNGLVMAIPSGSQLWKTVIVLDVIVNILVGISLGVGWQTYSLIRQENIYAGCAPLCGITPYFCSTIMGSLITSTIGFVVSFGLIMGTLHVCVDPFLLGDNS
ncbi:hypothetical protein MIMGU_mgv1a020337mg [Erythranthe guttata]|uniref:CASP-like protein n=1 Tax=Erythranthe guttata TaxID=4155 RepID=A0A022QQY8_ERYGU|nr:hypothetical protein MIMGU_mgv1a020919mg [Erythranthe guttata]EYU38178.1 hypothetical protein MIMGU_mgv1a020337mg [Erythranthe guttata]